MKIQRGIDDLRTGVVDMMVDISILEEKERTGSSFKRREIRYVLPIELTSCTKCRKLSPLNPPYNGLFEEIFPSSTFTFS